MDCTAEEAFTLPPAENSLLLFIPPVVDFVP
jgi:hypothetical protein